MSSVSVRDDLPEGLCEILRQTRFQQEGRAPFLARPNPRVCTIVGGHDYNRDISRPRVALDVANQVPAVGFRETHLRHNDIRMRRPRVMERVRAIGDGQDFKTETVEGLGVEVGVYRCDRRRGGLKVERAVGAGGGVPCGHCLQLLCSPRFCIVLFTETRGADLYG